MTLADLIRKREPGRVATAISAIPAIPDPQQAQTVAGIATVAVAKSGSEAPDGRPDAEDLREAFEERAENAKAEGVDLTSLLTEACQGVEGIDAATFRSLLSPEDIEDIEGGHIPANTLNAYARSFAEGIRCGRITVLAKAILTSRVRCADCRHFERDTIGDGAGIGDCKVQGEGTAHRQPALWPNVRRWCKDFESREGAA
ncbi:MAG: hypothetical protein USCGTAYLOR_02385 [Chromatiales bacterium USCg_Taylor]|nr:MAG: hypothetical protein USCGTAYLOR_02385 [Chromatiales bacterium USCg_Taylor]